MQGLMKNLTLLCFSLMLIGLQACTGDVKDDEQAVAVKDSAKIAVPMDKDDAQFALQAANNNMALVELGKLAVKNGHDKRIKNLGAMMIKDNAKADVKLQAIAKAKKITLPATIDTADKKTLDDLSKTTGVAFDRSYLSNITKDHEANIKLFQSASTQLMDPDLRAYAAKNLLTYKRHLDAIDGIKASIK
jgi:putative membrane protein